MSYPLASATGSALGVTISGDVNTKTRAAGALCVFNASQVAFLVQGSDGSQAFLSNGFGDKFSFTEGNGHFTLVPQFTVATGATNPDTVFFLVLSEAEDKADRRLWPIQLGANVGVATVSSVTNDGNPCATLILETTPAGAPGSTVKLDNTGQLKLNPWHGCVTVNPPLLDFVPQGYATNVHWQWLYNSTTGAMTLFDITDGTQLASFTPGNPGSLALAPIAMLGGQASAGGFGVPVMVAQANDVAIGDTALHTVITFTPPVTGEYRVSATFDAAGTNNPLSAVIASFTHPRAGAVNRSFFGVSSTGTIVQANGVNALAFVVPVQLASFTIRASSAGAITLTYQNNAAGTINDHVSFFLERLS